MKTRNQQLLEAVQVKREEIREKSREILEKQAEENRAPTDEETKTLAQFVKDMKTLDEQQADYEGAIKTEQDVLGIGRQIGVKDADAGVALQNGIRDVTIPTVQKSIGAIMVERLKSVRDSGNSRFAETVEIDTKGTLLSGTMAPGSGTGGGLVPVPQVVPGVVDKLFQPLSVADILPSGSTNTNSIRYVVEGTATSGAAGVAEAAAKPESVLGYSTTDEPVKKIATVLVASDEMLEDGAQVESLINSRLSLFIRIEEERQLVVGAGTNDLVGISGRSGVNTYARGTVDNNAVALFKAMNGTRGSSLLEPDAIIMHPDNWQTTRLLTDTAGQFFAGGPFQGPYGNGQNIPNSGQLTGASDSLWGKQVIVTTAAPGSGTALLGSFRGAAQVFRRSGLTVEATNAHSDYFTKNLVAIRAELRLALAVYRPAAFTKVTGLS